MARKNRSQVINEEEVSVYHVIDRCVRSAFLLDKEVTLNGVIRTRRQFLEELTKVLASKFMIDVSGFGFMINHMHMVLRNRPDLVKIMSDEDVLRAWWQISPDYRTKGNKPGNLTPKRLRKMLRDRKRIAECRKRLSSISWFMRYLKQPFSVAVNKVEETTGHVWEGRFKCIPIESVDQLLNAMIYVDLNPVRAGIAHSITQSIHTSAYNRAKSQERRGKLGRHRKRERKAIRDRDAVLELTDDWLSPIELSESSLAAMQRIKTEQGMKTLIQVTSFPDQETPRLGRARASDLGVLPITTDAYLMLVDLIGRRIHPGKVGKIPAKVPPILDAMGLGTPDDWVSAYEEFEQQEKQRYRRKVNTDEEASAVDIPFLEKTKSNQDALR